MYDCNSMTVNDACVLLVLGWGWGMVLVLAACGDGYWVYGMWLCMAMTMCFDAGVDASYAR